MTKFAGSRFLRFGVNTIVLVTFCSIILTLVSGNFNSVGLAVDGFALALTLAD